MLGPLLRLLLLYVSCGISIRSHSGARPGSTFVRDVYINRGDYDWRSQTLVLHISHEDADSGLITTDDPQVPASIDIVIHSFRSTGYISAMMPDKNHRPVWYDSDNLIIPSTNVASNSDGQPTTAGTVKQPAGAGDDGVKSASSADASSIKTLFPSDSKRSYSIGKVSFITNT